MTAKVFDKVEVGSVASQVYQVLKQAVLTGRLQPDHRVSEVELAAELKVSRTPLREALFRLEAEGFIQRQRGAIRVPPLSQRELDNLYEIRARLEGLAARQAADNATPDDIETLFALNARVDHTSAVDTVLLAGADFHHHIAVLANNSKNQEFIQNIMQHIARYRAQSTRDGHAGFADGHLRVLDAIATHDGTRAEAAMIEHIFAARDYISEKLRHQWPADASRATDG